MNEELIARLRTFGAEGFPVALEAANALEAMQQKLTRWRTFHRQTMDSQKASYEQLRDKYESATGRILPREE